MERKVIYQVQLELEKPLREVEETEHIPGWCDGRIMKILRELGRDKQCIVNIGVWKGKSTAALAENCAGIVWAVDHFLGNKHESIVDHQQARENPLSVYQEFMVYMSHFGFLPGKVLPLTCESALAAYYFLNSSIDVVYVDGAHDYKSVMADLVKWGGRVKPGGVICGDDYDWPGVRQAVDEYYKAYKSVYGWTLEVPIGDMMWLMRRAT